MKIRFVRPLPRIDHVIPAGFILDAPEGFAAKMIRTGRALPVTGGGEAPTLEDTDRGAAPVKAAEPAVPDPFSDSEEEEKEPQASEEPQKKPARARKGT